MKDIVIKGRSVKREVLIFIGCVVVVIIVNAVAIACYKTSWRELYSVWYAVLAAAVLLYIILIPLRFLGCWLGKAFRSVCCKKR